MPEQTPEQITDVVRQNMKAVREMVEQQASRKTRPHLLVAIDVVMATVEAQGRPGHEPSELVSLVREWQDASRAFENLDGMRAPKTVWESAVARVSAASEAVRQFPLAEAQPLPAREAEITRLTQENEQWKTWGIIEIATRNYNVSTYMEHWEARALKAEAEITRLRSALQTYGLHKDACVFSPLVLASTRPQVCTCGLDEALAGCQAPRPPEEKE